MADRMMMDKDGNICPVGMSVREQMALTIYVELFRHRNAQAMPADLFTEEQMATATVKATDALLQALEGKS